MIFLRGRKSTMARKVLRELPWEVSLALTAVRKVKAGILGTLQNSHKWLPRLIG